MIETTKASRPPTLECVGNKAFTAKKAIYKSAGTPMDPTLKNASAWTAKEITARTEALAKLAYDRVFNL